MVPSYKPPTVLRTTALKVVKMSPHPVQFFSVLLTSSPRFVPPSLIPLPSCLLILRMDEIQV